MKTPIAALAATLALSACATVDGPQTRKAHCSQLELSLDIADEACGTIELSKLVKIKRSREHDDEP